MPAVRDQYQLDATAAAVAAFHHDTRALKKLTPPPVIVQIHQMEPLGEGSISSFSLWFGPLRLRWRAVHSSVNPAAGFVDTQAAGPMALWRHTHAWRDLPGGGCEMREEIVYEHRPGPPGMLTRLLFARPMLRLMLAYRRVVICAALRPPRA